MQVIFKKDCQYNMNDGLPVLRFTAGTEPVDLQEKLAKRLIECGYAVKAKKSDVKKSDQHGNNDYLNEQDELNSKLDKLNKK